MCLVQTCDGQHHFDRMGFCSTWLMPSPDRLFISSAQQMIQHNMVSVSRIGRTSHIAGSSVHKELNKVVEGCVLICLFRISHTMLSFERHWMSLSR